MFVELHILQNFAPSNLNRDDTGAPKDCEFGGYRRARISSQCLKRAIRTAFREQTLMPEAHLATRTKRLKDRLSSLLTSLGRNEDEAGRVAAAALQAIGLGLTNDGKTQYLLFLGEAEIRGIADACQEHWQTLLTVADAGDTPANAEAGNRQSSREAKKTARQAFPAELARALSSPLDGGRAADLALFGRMVADQPQSNVDAACQVAHAISTNKVSMEFDFYTAVDDLKPEDTAGADMLGTVEFNSACFYRYANVDLEQLRTNLGGDEELARRTVEAFLRASVAAIPSGKQNSMAAQNPPSLVFAVVRERGLWSLANAFARPARPDGEGDLIQNSIRQMDAYWGALAQMYGEQEIVGKWVATLESESLNSLKGATVATVDTLMRNVIEVTRFGGGGER